MHNCVRICRHLCVIIETAVQKNNVFQTKIKKLLYFSVMVFCTAVLIEVIINQKAELGRTKQNSILWWRGRASNASFLAPSRRFKFPLLFCFFFFNYNNFAGKRERDFIYAFGVNLEVDTACHVIFPARGKEDYVTSLVDV